MIDFKLLAERMKEPRPPKQWKLLRKIMDQAWETLLVDSEEATDKRRLELRDELAEEGFDIRFGSDGDTIHARHYEKDIDVVICRRLAD